MVTALRLIGPLVVFVLLIAAVACSYAPKRTSSPSRLEKTCYHKGAWLPCFIKDEALNSQWDI